MNIGNEFFKMCKYVEMGDVKHNNFNSLYSCYGRPSDTKIRIDNYWRQLLFNECDDVISYGVKSYNCNMFTLNAIVKIDGVKYYLYITKTKNEIHRIKDENNDDEVDELSDDELEKNFILSDEDLRKTYINIFTK